MRFPFNVVTLRAVFRAVCVCVCTFVSLFKNNSARISVGHWSSAKVTDDRHTSCHSERYTEIQHKHITSLPHLLLLWKDDIIAVENSSQ